MKHIATLSVSVCALMAVAACGPGGSVIEADETASTQQAGEVTLADVRAAIEAPPETRGPTIDPAAANIDPFTNIYTEEQREAFAAGVTEAGFSPEELEASIEASEQTLAAQAAGAQMTGYRDALECAARFDLAAKAGALPAFNGQTHAREVLQVTVINYETNLAPTASEEEREQITSEYRENTYQNYLMVRDSIQAEDMAGDVLLAEAEACYGAYGLTPEEPEMTEADTDTDVDADAETPVEG